MKIISDSSNTDIDTHTMVAKIKRIYEDDRTIAVMSEEKRRSMALSACGMWADRDDDFDEMRSEMANASWNRLEKLYETEDNSF